MQKPYGVHWFRRDLRVAGNAALQWNFRAHSGRVLGIFCFDHSFLSRPDFSHVRFHFFLMTLDALRSEMRDLGGDLLILDVGPQIAFEKLFADLQRAREALPSHISWNRDYEPFARSRDKFMSAWFQEKGIPLHTERDHLVIEPEELFKESKVHEGYQVFTPFSRKWRELMRQPPMEVRIEGQKKGLDYLSKRDRGEVNAPVFSLTWKDLLPDTKPDLLETYLQSTAKRHNVPMPGAGSLAAFRALKIFSKKISGYDHARDIPHLSATSRMSMYLKNGSITVAQIISFLNLTGETETTPAQQKYLSELIWREFYYHILYRYPHVETQSFQPRYQHIAWQNHEPWFEAWKNGETGFPIVDAGMRELNQTGFMHNRVRMIVASFLTKDLLIDWRWGERYFMERLLDGDLAPNNGGWQWAASTGCDPQPYFRIFNPWLQSEKFDPEGVYIRRFIPELKDVASKALHTPPKQQDLSLRYPLPLVEHAQQKIKALSLYSAS